MSDSIRKATSRDLPAINDLLREVLAVHHAGRPDLFRPEGKKYTDGELLAIFADPLTPVFVYDRDGEVLGYIFCALQQQDSGSLQAVRTLYIDDLGVNPAYRGQQIGRALFGHAKAFARESGCHNLTLHVWECNPGARAFYEALGLKPQYTSMEMLCE